MPKARTFGRQYYQQVCGVVCDHGVTLPAGSTVLDFGCGAGQLVYDLRALGVRACGVNVISEYSDYLELCRQEGLVGANEPIFGVMDMANYRIPYDDESFDLVISWQVLEHVRNWPEALAEIERVLKLGGVGLHIFPTRLRPIEGHVFVPLGGILRSQPYLKLCALLGIRNEYQRDMSRREIAAFNREYLTTSTYYPTVASITRDVRTVFGNVSFAEASFLRHGYGRLRRYLPITRRIPFFAWTYRTFHTRVVLFTKPLAKSRDVSREPRSGVPVDATA